MKNLLILLMTILLPLAALADDSGKCGDNLTWTYDSATETLTISGNGPMWNYYARRPAPKRVYSKNVFHFVINKDVEAANMTFDNDVLPDAVAYPAKVKASFGDEARWYKYNYNIKAIIIENGVTSIGDNAFEDCSGLTSITIPNSVTSIGDFAFYGCYSLTSIDIPNSVTSIGAGAFEDCSGLTSIDIPNSVTSIGYDAFDGCSSLTSVEFHCKTIELLFRCLSDVNKEQIEQIIIGDEVEATSIGDYTFFGWSGLTSINIPNSVTSIGEGAFKGCSSLTSINIPNSVTSIGGDAFEGCSSLTKVNISDIAAWCNISFGDNPLSYAHNLYLNDEKITDLTIPNSVTSIGSYAFSGCSGLTSVTLGQGVTSIGEGAFKGCSSLTSINIPNSVTSIGSYAFFGCSGLTSVTLGQGVTSIGYGTFSGCSSLTSINIPNSVTSIGGNAFRGCNSLPIFDNIRYADTYLVEVVNKEIKTAVIKENTRLIGHFAFEDCTALTSITIPNSVTSIGEYAFSGCSGLTSVTIPNSVTSIGWYVFYGCSSLTSITIPNSVTSIGWYAFEGCSSLTSITIPNSVTSIGYDAFEGCSSLTKVNISDIAAWCNISFGDNPLSYAHNLYLNDEKITDLTIPNSVTSIGSYAFNGCSGLTSVNLGQGVTSIGSYAFNGCSGLTSVTLGQGVTSIGGSAFSGCSGLTSVEFHCKTIQSWFNGMKSIEQIIIGDEVTSIESSAFEECSGLTSITIPNSVTSIGGNAFYGCSGLTSVTFGQGVTSIGGGAFDNCSRLRSVYAEGTKAASIESSTFPNRTNQTLHVPIGCKTAYEESDYWWEFKTIIDDIVINVPYAVLSPDSTTLTFRYDNKSKEMAGTVYDIFNGKADPEWYGNRASFTKVVFDASFADARPTSTYMWFSGMVNLEEITGLQYLNTSEVQYMSYMFRNCHKLESLDLSHFDTHKVELMGFMFQACNNLKSIDLSSFNTSANTSFYNMFKDCTSLESLDISSYTFTENVESRYFFLNCTALKRLTIPVTMNNVNANALATVGTAESPCRIYAPANFDFGTDTSGESFQYKGGWFKLYPSCSLTASTGILRPGYTAKLVFDLINGEEKATALQCEIVLPDGLAIAKENNKFIYSLGDRCNEMQAQIVEKSKNHYSLILFSISTNTVIQGESGTVITLTLSADSNCEEGDYEGSLRNIVLTNLDYDVIPIAPTTFTITVSDIVPGDINHDGGVNVADVMMTVNYVLTGDVPNFHRENADVNGDGSIDISDVMGIVSIVLYAPSNAPTHQNHGINGIGSMTTIDTNNGYSLSLDNSEAYTALQMVVTLPSGSSLKDVLLNGNPSHKMSFQRLEGSNQYKVVVWSADGTALYNTDNFLQLQTSGRKGDITISDIQLTNEEFETIFLQDASSTTSIGDITTANTEDKGSYYTLSGQRINDAPTKPGIYIHGGKKVTIDH